MKIKLFISIMVAIFGITTIAQAQDDRNTVEFYGGYSYLKRDVDLDEEPGEELDFNGHGVNMSLTGNPHRYAGIKFDFSTHSKSQTFDDGTSTATAKLRTTQFLGGLQIKDNQKEGSRVRPFAHVLLGVARSKLSGSGFVDDTPPTATGGTGTFDFSGTSSDFAMVVGGGIDVNVSRRVAIRVIQIDYNPIFLGDQDFGDFEIEGQRQNNLRFGFGIVIH